MEREAFFNADRRLYIWIIIAGFLLYARTLAFDFTYLDDNILILGNLKFLANSSNIFHAFTQQVFKESLLPYYRPMLTVSLILDTQLAKFAGLSMYHLTNIVIHILASCLVFTFLMRLGYRKEPSFILSLIYTIHPMLTPAVAWIPGRNDSLLACFALFSFIFFLDFLKTNKWKYYLYHILFFALGIFTKESGIILILMCIFYLVLIERPAPRVSQMRAFILGWSLVTALWYFARSTALRGNIEMTVFDMASSLALYLPAIIQLIGKALFPFNLSVFPTLKETTFIYGIMAIALLCVLTAVSKDKRKNFIAFGFLWCLLFIIPSLVRPSSSIVNDVLEHRFYLSMVGIIIVLMETDMIKRFSWGRKVHLTAAALVLVIFSVIALIHSEDFRNKEVFWKKAVVLSPSSLYPNLFMGYVYYLDNEPIKAEKFVKKALEMEPLAIRAHYYLGSIYLEQGRYDEAIKEFRKEVVLYPYFNNTYVAWGVACYRQGRFAEAEGLWKRALEADPDNIEAIKNLAIYCYEVKNYPQAIYYVNEARKRGLEPPPEFLKALGL